ncbi:hypothetical protein N9D57_03805 [bacterium]|nr:hypothetical protein [bacterium]
MKGFFPGRVARRPNSSSSFLFRSTRDSNHPLVCGARRIDDDDSQFFTTLDTHF